MSEDTRTNREAELLKRVRDLEVVVAMLAAQGKDLLTRPEQEQARAMIWARTAEYRKEASGAELQAEPEEQPSGRWLPWSWVFRYKGWCAIIESSGPAAGVFLWVIKDDSNCVRSSSTSSDPIDTVRRVVAERLLELFNASHGGRWVEL